MKHYLAVPLLAAGLALIAGQSSATTLGLITEAPSLSASAAFVDYLEFGTDGDISTFGTEVDFTDGASPIGATEVGFGVGFALADPTTGATGGFDITDDNGLFLTGDLFAVGYAEDIIELQFNNLGGSSAGTFGSSVLALIAFDDPLGPNPFASLFDGDSLGASVTFAKVATSTIAPVPLPASAVLLLGGLFALRPFRRSKQTTQVSRDGQLNVAIPPVAT